MIFLQMLSVRLNFVSSKISTFIFSKRKCPKKSRSVGRYGEKGQKIRIESLFAFEKGPMREHPERKPQTH